MSKERLVWWAVFLTAAFLIALLTFGVVAMTAVLAASPELAAFLLGLAGFWLFANRLIFGYGSLVASVILGFVAAISGSENILLSAAWFFMMGFVGFLITGHLYKIIPFLVWFERYSPLVGKKRVPMLADMVPHKMAEFQFWFSSAGVLLAGLGLLIGSDDLFKGGAAFIATGAIFLTMSVKWMMNFGKK